MGDLLGTKMLLSPDQTEQIRQALQGGVTPLEIARRLSVSLIAIAHVIAAGLEHALPRARTETHADRTFGGPLSSA